MKSDLTNEFKKRPDKTGRFYCEGLTYACLPWLKAKAGTSADVVVADASLRFAKTYVGI
jgi:hypothetical protein